MAERAAVCAARCALNCDCPPGTFQEHDHFPRDAKCQFAPVVFLDHGKRQVHPGGDARRSVELPVPDVDRVWIDLRAGARRSQALDRVPVGRDLLAFEQPRLGQDECTGAHGPNAPNL
jgi:hypothetical protein